MNKIDSSLLILAMPGSGKSTTVDALKRRGIVAIDADYGTYRKMMTHGKHHWELSSEETDYWRRQYYDTNILKWARAGYMMFTNEPDLALLARNDHIPTLFILPSDPKTVAYAVRDRSVKRDGTFSQRYLEMFEPWYKDWVNLANKLKAEDSSVRVIYGNLPYDFLTIVEQAVIRKD